MTKPRARVWRDGRVGFPAVLEYELTEGPDKGTRVPVIPTFASHPHPDPAALREANVAHVEASCAYRTIVHDPVEFRRLHDDGFWQSVEHCGRRAEMVDNRRAPAV